MSTLTLVATLANAFFAGINIATLVTNIWLWRAYKRTMTEIERLTRT